MKGHFALKGYFALSLKGYFFFSLKGHFALIRDFARRRLLSLKCYFSLRGFLLVFEGLFTLAELFLH